MFSKNVKLQTTGESGGNTLKGSWFILFNFNQISDVLCAQFSVLKLYPFITIFLLKGTRLFTRKVIGSCLWVITWNILSSIAFQILSLFYRYFCVKLDLGKISTLWRHLKVYEGIFNSSHYDCSYLPWNFIKPSPMDVLQYPITGERREKNVIFWIKW